MLQFKISLLLISRLHPLNIEHSRQLFFGHMTLYSIPDSHGWIVAVHLHFFIV